MTCLPSARGALSAALFLDLRAAPTGPVTSSEISADSAADEALALWTLHELGYRGFDEVDDAAEQVHELVGLRLRLEASLESRLRRQWPGPPSDTELAGDFFDWVADFEGPSLARHVQAGASREQVLELIKVRSIYHLKEADPTTWVIPRLPDGAKAALVALQYDEYGVGDPGRLHAHLWAAGMEASGLCSTYGAYADLAPVEILEQNNTLTMFGLQRRLRGAAVGHLAAFEASSSLPSKQMARGLRRLDFPEQMAHYYDEHVEADAVHEQVAVRDICVALVDDDPRLEADVWFGAWACLELEARTARAVLASWDVAA